MKSSLLITFAILFLFSCSNSKKSAKDTTQNKPISELPLAPGQLQALLEVIEVNTEEPQKFVSAKVLEVVKYGSATPPVPSETIIQFRMNNDGFEKLKDTIKPDAIINVTLSAPESGKSQKTSNYWNLISINN